MLRCGGCGVDGWGGRAEPELSRMEVGPDPTRRTDPVLRDAECAPRPLAGTKPLWNWRKRAVERGPRERSNQRGELGNNASHNENSAGRRGRTGARTARAGRALTADRPAHEGDWTPERPSEPGAHH